ncbi:phytase [uncultured Aquimarina sp.]|uniref:phytase n=1 Tax=uncultured Aquimarina sp. TaxID=575652 RepID=UPI002614B14F|nr:phytase [uncultured Aquimarina sp.]
MKIYRLILVVSASLIISCDKKEPLIQPDLITEKVLHDTDDPAIWVHPTDPSKSIIFGTDKDTNGAIYAFDLDGKIIPEKVIRDIKYPNNIDLEYGFRLNDSTTTDIIVFTEREKNQIRLFSVPDMKPLDGGGFLVFEDEKNLELRRPMGIGLYKNPNNHSVTAIVSRKSGPENGYLYQYQLVSDSLGVHAKLVRKFGKFSQQKEIEAIAVDDELGFVYYSDEGVGIRKYYADAEMGNEELAFFGGEFFKEDIEGIAIASKENGHGFLIVSDQQKGQFNVFSRKDNSYIKAINLGTTATDGCDVVTIPLGATFTKGLFVAMNEQKDFYLYDLGRLGL